MKNCLKLLRNIYCSTPIPDILNAIGPFSLLGSFESCCRLTKGKDTFWIQHSIRTSRLDQSTVDWVHPLFHIHFFTADKPKDPVCQSISQPTSGEVFYSNWLQKWPLFIEWRNEVVSNNGHFGPQNFWPYIGHFGQK